MIAEEIDVLTIYTFQHVEMRTCLASSAKMYDSPLKQFLFVAIAMLLEVLAKFVPYGMQILSEASIITRGETFAIDIKEWLDKHAKFGVMV